MKRPDWRTAVALLLVTVFAFSVAVVLHRSPVPPSTITVPLGGPGPTSTVTTTPQAIDAAGDVGDHQDARDETPIGITGAQVSGAQHQAQALAKSDPVPLVQPEAAPSQPGCRSNFVSSYSSRGGTRPLLIVDHYTVSPNRPGWDDINGLTAYSNNSRNGVSWAYNFDQEGNCAYTVRETDKAWTQATMNRVSIGREIVNTGKERPLFTARGWRTYERVTYDSARRWQIPLRRGKINKSTCRVARSGIVDHNDLGVCGGSHYDITPFDVDVNIAQVKLYAATRGSAARKQAKWCRSLKILRAQARARRSTPQRRSRARKLKTLLGAKAATCR